MKYIICLCLAFGFVVGALLGGFDTKHPSAAATAWDIAVLAAILAFALGMGLREFLYFVLRHEKPRS